MDHAVWMADTGERLTSADGRSIEIWSLECDFSDDDVWRRWAKHFRQHYCADELIDALKAGTPYAGSRAEYLRNLVFPDANAAPGPSIRSGDFSEILISDLLQFHLGYEVPRTRYGFKAVRNESAKGTDIIGMKFAVVGTASAADELITCETKAQLTGKKANSRLQNAIDDSAKDELRKAVTLNAAKHRLLVQGNQAEAEKIARFQDPIDNPYISRIAAAAVFDSDLLDKDVLVATNGESHPASDIKLIVLHGKDLMGLVNALFERAANEA